MSYLTWPLRAVCWIIMIASVAGIAASSGLGLLAKVSDDWLAGLGQRVYVWYLLRRYPASYVISQ